MGRVRRRPAAVFLLLGLAYALPVAGLGWNQGAHFAQIEALAHGTGRVDPYRWLSGDLAWYHGHYYSTKAPGLALLAEPFYLPLRATGLLRFVAGHTASPWQAAQVSIWILGLCVVVPSAVALLLLVRVAAERVVPGYGTPVAVALGIGTLVLPFSTVFFSHVPAAALGFGAFLLVWRTGDHPRRLRLAAAGALVGFGIAVEYTLAIVCVVLAVYLVAVERRRIASLASFGAGVLAGVSPLLVYDRLVYGAFTHVSYLDAISRRGASGHAVLGENARGLFGFSVPDPRVAFEVLFDSRGLFVVAPVLLMGLVGLVLMLRSRWRAEAWASIAILLGFLVFDAGYFLPFGGLTPGPRFLVAALPFLAVPLALAYHRFPAPTATLAGVSAVLVVCATITHPMLANGDTAVWARDLASGRFAETAARVLGLPNSLGVAVFLAAVLGGAVLLLRGMPAFRGRHLRTSLSVLVAWLAAAAVADAVASAGWPAVVLEAAAACVSLCVIGTATLRTAVRSRTGAAAVASPGA